MTQVTRTAHKRLVSMVRRHRPSLLLPLIAKRSAHLSALGLTHPKALLDGGPVVTPWALASVARESIVHGSEVAIASTRPRDVDRLCRIYADLDDPLGYPGTDGAELRGFLVRMAFEQFRSQMSLYEEVARTMALYIDAAAGVPGAPLLSAGAWETSLGCPLSDFIRVAFFLNVWAMKHDGWVDLDWLAMPQFAPVLAQVPASRIRQVVETHLATGFAEFRKRDAKEVCMPRLEEHRFNYLQARPLVRLSGRLLAPSPMLLLDRVSSTGLYYDRTEEVGFTDQLGRVFERYVGDNLRLIKGADVRPDIRYARGKHTVDWIVVLKDLVVLVEAKTTRLTAEARLGIDAALERDIARTLVRAHEQIEATSTLIRQRHPALVQVPSDRPILGVVATLEPYWLLGTELTPVAKPPGATVPLVTASIRDIEHLGECGAVGPVNTVLQEMRERGGGDGRVLSTALQTLPKSRNPLLEHGWATATDWHAAADESAK